VTYELVSRATQQGGTILFVLMFAAAAAYAFWPRNRETFRKAAHAALEPDDLGGDLP